MTTKRAKPTKFIPLPRSPAKASGVWPEPARGREFKPLRGLDPKMEFMKLALEGR